jgi:predicted nuclease of predicted toxin-antitoxin system
MALQLLKILTDENISPRVVSFLREKGIDVIDVKEKGWQGADDKLLMAVAWEEGRFILTHDSDFGTLAIYEGVPCYGIIYLRLKDLRVEKIKESLGKFIKIEKEISEGTIIVLQDRQLRIRPIVR